ncbi:MAG TPA: tRNA-dihydrouridine synthase [Candidatus Paceibacterota bacterium]
MIQGFWKKLKKPIFVLAPMADVTDAAFRRIIAKYSKYNGKFTRRSPGGGGPDVFWTEFVSVDGLVSAGKDRLEHLLKYSPQEHPIVAQVFGFNPDNFERAARIIKSRGFDGIDINMGCPERKVLKQGAGAALTNTPKLAQKIIMATQKGAGSLPVSVKIRIGDSEDVLSKWLPRILETRPAAVTIHFRTRKEMSSVPAHWESAPLAMELAGKYAKNGVRTLIIGNGDVKNLGEAKQKIKEYGLDGVMIGRGIFGNPWLFSKRKKSVSREDKLKVLLEHAKLYERMFKGQKPFDIMKRHFKAYVNGFEGAKELRVKLMSAKNAKEVEKLLKSGRGNPGKNI